MRRQPRYRYIKGQNGKYLVNQYGRPVSACYGFYEASQYPNRYGDTLPPTNGTGAIDWRGLLSPTEWKRVISVARWLFANAPILRGALMEQATLSFPLEAQYVGQDKAWGRMAEEHLYNWRKTANVKGYPYDGECISRIRLIGRKVDGDVATLLTEHDDGSPAIRIFSAHAIGDREWQVGAEIESGEYKGYVMDNGVIHDANGRHIAYRVLGESAEEDIDIPATAMFLLFRPTDVDQFRGLSEMVASIPDFNSVSILRQYELRCQQIQSSYAFVETNETGEPEPPGADNITFPDSDQTTSGTGSGLVYQTYEGGLHKYFRAGSNARLDLVKPDRPGQDTQNFEDRIITAALYGIEWDANFALAIKEPGGAWARAIIEKVRRCVQNNQRIEAQAMLREDVYCLAKDIQRGVIPSPSDSDIFSWVYQGPGRITADSGNEQKDRREAYKLGTATLKELEGEQGKWWEEVRGQKEVEVGDLLARTERLASQYPQLTFSEVLNLLEQRSPNPMVGSAGSVAPAEEDAETIDLPEENEVA